jgi:hypothetical protein
MRFLRLSHPLKAEHDFEDNLWVEHELRRLAAAGVVIEDGYNSRKASLAKEADHVVNVVDKDQHGKTFKDGRIPEELRELPTIEVPREGRLAEARVASMVAGAASKLPPKERLAAAPKLQEVMTGLQALAPAAGKGAPTAYFRSVFERAVEQEAMALVGRLATRIYPLETLSQPESALIDKFEFDMMVAYRDFVLNGYQVSVLLLLCAISRAASPTEPLRRSFDKLAGKTREIKVQEVLASMLMEPGSLDGLGAAASHLLSMGRTAWDSVGDAANVDDFYHRQFTAMPHFHGCYLVNFVLMQLNPDPALLERLNTQCNEADEYLARAYTAMMHDFQNAIDLGAIAGSRRMYHRLASQRPRFARISLQKWLNDDRMFPEFWAPFVTGASEELFWDRPQAATA